MKATLSGGPHDSKMVEVPDGLTQIRLAVPEGMTGATGTIAVYLPVNLTVTPAQFQFSNYTGT